MYKYSGILIKNRREKSKLTHGQMVKGLMNIMNPEKLKETENIKEVEMPRKRREVIKNQETRKYSQKEKEFRIELIKYLRKKKCRVWRIENSLQGYKGLPDLWVVNLKTFWSGWIEIKSLKGRLKPEQDEFRSLCKLTNVNHIVVRKKEDVTCIINL